MALDWQTQYHRYQRYFTNITRLYQKKEVRVYTEIILFIFTVVFFLIFAIKPTLITIAGLLKTIKDQETVAQQLEEKIKILGPAQNQYNLIKPDLYLIEEALPEKPMVSLLLKQLEALGRRTGVNLRTVQINQVIMESKTPSPNLEEIKFDLSAEGDYQNLKNLLENMVSLRRLITIESFSFDQKMEEEKPALLLNIKAKAYFLAHINQE